MTGTTTPPAADEAATLGWLDALRNDPTNRRALRALAALALAGGHRSAARTALGQLVQFHPDDANSRVALADVLVTDGALIEARAHYQAVLDAHPALAAAHQGLARLLAELGDPAAERHRKLGFTGNAVVTQRYRGEGAGVPLLLLVSACGGNIPTRPWIDDRIFAVTAVYADFHHPTEALPPHRLVVNAIGDADLCGEALVRAEAMLTDTTVPVINCPARVALTGRSANARRLGGIDGVRTPITATLPRSALLATVDLRFPLLLRTPGFHTGAHFIQVRCREALARAVASLPGDDLLAIEYLPARGADGMARKYRVMFIDGACYPLHLAVSADWKVHYFTAAMADSTVYRQEEREFLDDMAATLGGRAMTALHGIAGALGLDYAGADFALSADGSVLLFEANATMVIVPPGPEAIWDYRRPAIAEAQSAIRRMLGLRLRNAGLGAGR